MEQSGKILPQPKTSTGIPVNQSFTPPVGASSRPLSAIEPQRDIFKGLLGDTEKSKLPSSVTINCPLDDVAEKIKDMRNFSVFFEGLERVETLSPEQSQWYFRDNPEAVAMRLESRDNFVLWRSEDPMGFPFTLAIYLEAAQADRGTVVRLLTSYDSTAGKIAGTLEKIFGKDASVRGKIVLQRLKAFCETGHIPTTEGQPHGSDEDSKIISPQNHQSTLSRELSN